MKKFYLVAGEASGDSRGAELMRSLREIDGDIAFGGAGGARMCAIPGADHVRNWAEEAAVVGVWEVLRKYGYFRREFDRVRGEIAAWKPDAVILIDYPGFNLRLAKALRREMKAQKIIYYVSPQVWAWNRGRVKEMARTLDLMICIFPFEKEIYDGSGLEAVFVGHPILDELGPMRDRFAREENVVGLFPGSRAREVEKLFPVMLEAADIVKHERPETCFLAPAVSVPIARMMRRYVEMSPLMKELDCEIVRHRAHEVMQRATCAVIASGTATLEAAFFGLPYCLVYRASWPTYLAFRVLVKVKMLGIVNILAGREVVREYLQEEASAPNMAAEILRFLGSDEERRRMRDALLETVAKLGEEGAAPRAARVIMRRVFPGETAERELA